ncbi:hypothetical protein [Halapricum desulfuricans]|uniref:hypothetical protein n=1 Tax=Halapricum desulfuricans TaxID=2841257 RepID=UPI001E5FA79E|nr:hypothetical protein [Halapricum desulfuricans]
MVIPGGIEVLVVPGLVVLAVVGLVGKYILKWMQEGYEEEVAENQPDRDQQRYS